MKLGKRRLIHGWNPDLPDHRDRMFLAPAPTVLPASVDLRPQCPPVYDQGQLGSCTGNSNAGLHHFRQLAQKETAFAPSRLQIYYNERAMEGSINTDSGAQIRDGMKSIATLGVCPETLWPYNIAKFATKPPAACYTEALKHQAITYARLVPTLSQLQGALASGNPFVFGFTVYESFESQAVASSGIVPMPKKGEQVLGGHAVMAVGYIVVKGVLYIIVRNSWGTGWGQDGYFLIPASYVTNPNLADDMWTLSLVE